MSDNSIKSDEKFLDIIEFLQASDGAGVTETADHLGIAKSTVHCHLTTLRQRGYVVKKGIRMQLDYNFSIMESMREEKTDLSSWEKKR